MKKKWIGVMLIAGLLFASCRQEVPGNTPGTTVEPTAYELPTGIWEEPSDAEHVLEPTPGPETTENPSPSVVPTPTQGPEPTETPEPTEVPASTGEADPTTAPAEETDPSGFLQPSPSPIPDTETLVYHGWQRAISIDEAYEIIFPERFCGSSLEKTDRELTVIYTDPSDERVIFRISYWMQTTLEDFLARMSLPESALVYDGTEENRVNGVWQIEGTMYRGSLIETRYAKELLGSSFEGEEWIPGVMEVVFSYPQEQQQDYETAEYDFYVMNLGRE